MLSCSKNEFLSLRLLSSSGHAPHCVGERLEGIGCISSSDTSVAIIAWREGDENDKKMMNYSRNIKLLNVGLLF
jgi:hypothetical protein